LSVSDCFDFEVQDINRTVSFLESMKQSLIDLHVHSNFSDGDQSPLELIRLAKEANVSIFSIADHDTILGIRSLTDKKVEVIDGVTVVSGVELSAQIKHGRMHVLGYGIDLTNKKLNDTLKYLHERSISAVLTIIEQIKKDYGIIFTDSEVEQIIQSQHNVNRVDVAKKCVEKGYAIHVQDAFDKYLVDAFLKTRGKNDKGLPYAECISLIKEAGGIPVLAHPKTLELENKEFYKKLEEFIDLGLEGIEVYHSSYTEDESQFYREVADKYHLLCSGGTDFHGKSIKPGILLGTGKNNNVKIKKLSILDRLID